MWTLLQPENWPKRHGRGSRKVARIVIKMGCVCVYISIDGKAAVGILISPAQQGHSSRTGKGAAKILKGLEPLPYAASLKLLNLGKMRTTRRYTRSLLYTTMPKVEKVDGEIYLFFPLSCSNTRNRGHPMQLLHDKFRKARRAGATMDLGNSPPQHAAMAACLDDWISSCR